MLNLPGTSRVFLAREAVDFRKAHDGLAQLVRARFGQDPLSGDVFAFLNRRRDRVKILTFDRNGLWLLYKRLERGTFPLLPLEGVERAPVERAHLLMLLEGIDLRSARFHARHVAHVRTMPRTQHGRRDGPS